MRTVRGPSQSAALSALFIHLDNAKGIRQPTLSNIGIMEKKMETTLMGYMGYIIGVILSYKHYNWVLEG